MRSDILRERIIKNCVKIVHQINRVDRPVIISSQYVYEKFIQSVCTIQFDAVTISEKLGLLL